MTRPNDESNDRSRVRMIAVIERLGEEGLRGRIDETWTASALLGHMAFWDRLHLERWKAYAGDGVFDVLPDGFGNSLNDSMLAEWIALSPKKAARLAVAAADAIDHWIANLPDEAIAAARAARRDRLVDRGLHRNSHLDEIERAYPQ